MFLRFVVRRVAHGRVRSPSAVIDQLPCRQLEPKPSQYFHPHRTPLRFALLQRIHLAALLRFSRANARFEFGDPLAQIAILLETARLVANHRDDAGQLPLSRMEQRDRKRDR